MAAGIFSLIGFILGVGKLGKTSRKGVLWFHASPRTRCVQILARCSVVAILLAHVGHTHAQQSAFSHFEARHTHSIALTPDGTRLLALNSPDARLSVFDVSDAANPEPLLIAEIPVGLEPVSVRARTNDEAWVVSELGDSIAVVSLSRGVVIDTLAAPDEPADIVFAQGKAFVSCARNQLIRVFDASTRAPLATIPLEGNYPRALATNADGTKLYAAFLLSGNNTTTIPYSKTTAAERVGPTDPLMPLPPQTPLIVPSTDTRVPYTVLDRDVAEIDAVNHSVIRYLGGAGTNLFDIAVHPQTSDIWVANTNARNATRFEHDLRGRVVDHRLTKLNAGDGAPTVYDTNAGFNYLAPMPYAFGRNNSIAQPTGIAFTPDGTHAWVTGFNSDRLLKIATANGSIVTRVDVRPTGLGPRGMRGPRALALKPASKRLYVLNKLANTISVVSITTDALLVEVPAGSYDPTPIFIKEGRGFLFDARISGRGLISCASCHLDADLDGIAWDLGDRNGTMMTVPGKNLSAHDETTRNRSIHPMKGPMVTQTLRGMLGGAPFHWRGDRASLQAFNPTFDKLMGGAQLSTPDIDALTEYLFTLKHHPNPNLQVDGSFPSTFQGGDVARGKRLFEDHLNHCISCHALPPGVARDPTLPVLPNPINNIDLHSEVGAPQPIKNPPLATVYQRTLFRPIAGQTTITGFGLLHDGSGSGALLPTVHPYTLDENLLTLQDFADVTAFVLCFHTGTAPSVGVTRTITTANRTEAGILNQLALLESQTSLAQSELILKGIIGGRTRSFRFDTTTQSYVSDSVDEPPISRADLLALLVNGDALTFFATLPGDGSRLGVDRDRNGVLDRDEPAPALTISPNSANSIRLQWPNPSNGWFLQFSDSLTTTWQPMTRPIIRSGAVQWRDESTVAQPAAYFRLRRTW